MNNSVADNSHDGSVDQNLLIDLSQYSLIRVSGADALAFLNAQLTNDVRQIETGRAQINAWCSAKGRALVVALVIRNDDGYLLLVPAPLGDDLMKRLRMYVLRSKVTLANADDAFVPVSVIGPEAATLVRNATGVAPENAYECEATNHYVVIRAPGAQPRYLILATPDGAPALKPRLRERTLPAPMSVWDRHDIMAGIPRVLPDTAEMFVPQMLNLDLIDGVSFTKGCYPGQEIVARVHYRGRIKERMFRAHLAENTAPAPGDPVYAVDMPGGQATGNVVIAAPAPAGGHDLLIVAHLSSVQHGDLRFGTAEGPRLTIEPLPYAVPLA